MERIDVRSGRSWVDCRGRAGAVYFQPVFALVAQSSRHTKNKTLHLADTVGAQWSLLTVTLYTQICVTGQLLTACGSLDSGLSCFHWAARILGLVAYFLFHLCQKNLLLLTYRMDFGLEHIDTVCFLPPWPLVSYPLFVNNSLFICHKLRTFWFPQTSG